MTSDASQPRLDVEQRRRQPAMSLVRRLPRVDLRAALLDQGVRRFDAVGGPERDAQQVVDAQSVERERPKRNGIKLRISSTFVCSSSPSSPPRRSTRTSPRHRLRFRIRRTTLPIDGSFRLWLVDVSQRHHTTGVEAASIPN